MELSGDPAVTGTQVSGDGHEANRGIEDQDQRATDTGEGTGQHALLASSMSDDDNKERRPPEQQRALNTCSHQGGKGGGDPSPSSAHNPRAEKGREGATPTRQCATLARRQGKEEGGVPLNGSVHTIDRSYPFYVTTKLW